MKRVLSEVNQEDNHGAKRQRSVPTSAFRQGSHGLAKSHDPLVHRGHQFVDILNELTCKKVAITHRVVVVVFFGVLQYDLKALEVAGVQLIGVSYNCESSGFPFVVLNSYKVPQRMGLLDVLGGGVYARDSVVVYRDGEEVCRAEVRDARAGGFRRTIEACLASC